MNATVIWQQFERLLSTGCQPGDLWCIVTSQVDGIADILKQPLVDTIKLRVDPENVSPGFVTQLQALTLGELFEGYVVLLTAPCHVGSLVAPLKLSCLNQLEFGNMSIAPIIQGVIQQRITLISNQNMQAEAATEQSLNTTFTAIRSALQSNPSANISGLLEDYKASIQTAFGVTFTVSDGTSADETETPSEWNLASIHFVRLGLEATAKAFERWVEAELNTQNLGIIINRYEIYRRVLGDITFENIGRLGSNVAQATSGKIQVLRRPKFIPYYYCKPEGSNQFSYSPTVDTNGNPLPLPTTGCAWQADKRESLPQYESNEYGVGNMVSANRQAIMTPNNLIHELGHSFDGRAGFGTKLLGSIEFTASKATAPSLSTNRDGMGPDYLRDLSYEHARIEETPQGSGVATFEAINPPPNYSPVYNGTEPSGYLLYDIFGTNYALWNSSYNIYRVINMNTRIDAYVHNPDSSTYTEPVADAFLNWVRLPQETTGPGLDWRNFMENKMGMFLRNAVIYRDMIGFYSVLGIISNNPIAVFNKSSVVTNVRLTPVNDVNIKNLIYSTNNPQDVMPSFIEVYGIIQIQGLYWLYVKDANRLVWTISSVAQTGQGTPITPQTLDLIVNNNKPYQPIKIDQVIDLSQSFIAADLSIVIGK